MGTPKPWLTSCKGLKFAPAVDGDEAAYIALHQALVNSDAGASAQLAAEVKR
jgi:hypothetical protein